MYSDIKDTKSNISEVNLSFNDLRRNSFLVIQENKYREKIQNNVNAIINNNKNNSISLSKIFFSKDNVNKIQLLLKQELFRRTKGKVILKVDQDPNDINIVMKHIFSETTFSNENIENKIKKLNINVINYVIPEIITNIKQYYIYIQDISNPIKPIDRPINVNNKGRKALWVFYKK